MQVGRKYVTTGVACEAYTGRGGRVSLRKSQCTTYHTLAKSNYTLCCTCTYTLHCIFAIIQSCHPLLNNDLLLRSCTAHTFGDSILMTSFRKRNFPNSA